MRITIVFTLFVFVWKLLSNLVSMFSQTGSRKHNLVGTAKSLSSFIFLLLEIPRHDLNAQEP